MIITDETKKQVIEAYKKTQNNKMLAEQFNLSITSIIRITRELRESINLTCPVCGKSFKMFRKKTYCSSECWEEAYKDRKKFIDEKYRSEQIVKKEIENYEKKANYKKKCQTLADIDREAREQGMTYGKYVAYLEQKKK